MVGFHLVALFALSFAFFSCEGKITSPLDGTKYTIVPGGSRSIAWNFDDDISAVIARSWSFTSTDGLRRSQSLAVLPFNSDPLMQPGILPGINITKPATLVLNNVNQSYDGTYTFTLGTSTFLTFSVRVFIAKKPNVTLNCSSVTLNEGDDFMCECKGLGGNPPANVTWYKNGGQMQGKTGTEEQLLNLTNIDNTDSGTYMCVAESYSDALYRDEESIRVDVRYSDSSLGIGAIIGIIIGVLVLLIIIIVVVWRYKLKEKDADRYRGNCNVDPTDGDQCHMLRT